MNIRQAKILMEMRRCVAIDMKKGYVALVTVLIMAAVAVGAVTTVALLGIGEAQTGLASTDGETTLRLVESCTEDALSKVRSNSAYVSNTLVLPEGSCSVVVTKAGSNWTLVVTNSAGKYKRTIQVDLSRSSKLVINSWKEI